MTLETWSHWLFIAGCVALGAGWLGTAFVKDRQYERWLYWFGSLTGGAFVSLSLADRGWNTVVIVAVGLALVIVFFQAYFKTPYIRIRGRNHAFSMQDSAPDPADVDPDEPPSMPPRDSYPGRITARKAWWLFVAIVAIPALGGALTGWDAKTLPLRGGWCAWVRSYPASTTRRASFLKRAARPPKRSSLPHCRFRWHSCRQSSTYSATASARSARWATACGTRLPGTTPRKTTSDSPPQHVPPDDHR